MKIINRWTGEVIRSIRGKTLSGINLSNTDLSWADLSGKDLSGSDLSAANLMGVNLSGANLSGANLKGANLCETDLSGTILPAFGFVPLSDSVLAKLILDRESDRIGSVNMSLWHSEFRSTHCVLGWAVVLNGERGLALEAELGVKAAGPLLFPSFAPYVWVSTQDATYYLRKIAKRSDNGGTL